MASEPDQADVAVVVVHGIGEQLRGATLLEWAEPIARRLDYLSRRRNYQGARVSSSRLTEDGWSEVRVEIEVRPGSRRTILFLEARWAASFLSFDPESFIGWAIGFVGTAAKRVARHTFRFAASMFRWNPSRLPNLVSRRLMIRSESTERILSGRAVYAYLETFTAMVLGVFEVIGILITALTSVLGALVYVVLILPVPILAWVGLVILGIFAKMPFLSRWIEPLLVALTSTIGDAAAWTRSPIRADAMRQVVRDTVKYAALSSSKVIVVAHSQGAAVAARALFHEAASDALDTVITVGGANTLLREPTWEGARTKSASVVNAWAEQDPARFVHWVNIWSSLDPVPAGPIGSTDHEVKKRWREIRQGPRVAYKRLTGRLPNLPIYAHLRYANLASGKDLGTRLARSGATLLEPRPVRPDKFDGLWAAKDLVSWREWRRRRSAFNRAIREARAGIGAGDGAIGPEERVVENRLSVFSDHTTYTTNTIEVIDPIARMIWNKSAGITESPWPQPITADQLAHRNGLTALAIGKLAIAILSLGLAPILVEVFAKWDPFKELDAGELRDWNSVVGFLLDVLDKYGVAGVVTFFLIASGVFLILSSLATSLWKIYDQRLAWTAKGSRSRTTFGTLHFGLVFAVMFAAIFLVLVRVNVDATLAVLVAAYAAYFAVLVPNFRLIFYTIPERRRNSNS